MERTHNLTRHLSTSAETRIEFAEIRTLRYYWPTKDWDLFALTQENMKVILQKDVAKIGRRLDVVDVPDGYALNHLIPQGSARPATKGNVRQVEAQKAKREGEVAAADAEFADVCARITAQTVQLTADANEKGHLFKGINATDIAATLDAAGYSVPETAIELSEPIKELGDHALTLSRGEHRATFTLQVTNAS